GAGDAGQRPHPAGVRALAGRGVRQRPRARGLVAGLAWRRGVPRGGGQPPAAGHLGPEAGRLGAPGPVRGAGHQTAGRCHGEGTGGRDHLRGHGRRRDGAGAVWRRGGRRVLMADWHPHVTVASVVAREGRLLMVEERIRGELVLNQPAGHLEPGETPAEAAVREALEETGWDIRLDAFIGCYQWQAPDGSDYLRFAFAGTALLHHPERALDEGIERAVWLAPDELLAESSRHRSP